MSRLTLHNVNVHYPIMKDHYRSIRRALLRTATGGKMYKEDAGAMTVHALKDLSFELKDGDRIGLIGRNGAGKSTLLRTLGGFILPESGTVTVEGEITSLFSLNGGMDLERTGYDNIFLMGRLRGLSRQEMEGHLPGIVEFSELGDHLSMPVHGYSDGMKVRLGIAVVTCVQPDILLLDEAIGAGDASFIEKATQRAHRLYERANIMVMASHSAKILKSLCNKAMWIDQGRIVQFGEVEEVLESYLDKTTQAGAKASQADAA